MGHYLNVRDVGPRVQMQCNTTQCRTPGHPNGMVLALAVVHAIY